MAFTVSTLSIKIPLKHRELAERQSETKYVFAHFIVSEEPSFMSQADQIRLRLELLLLIVKMIGPMTFGNFKSYLSASFIHSLSVSRRKLALMALR